MSEPTPAPTAAPFEESAQPVDARPTTPAGPWDPRACHGGPVSALLTRAVELADPESPVDWQIARLTIELTRPVPVGRPLTLTTDIERPGRKVSLVSARLDDEETEVARVRALRIRRTDLELPDDTVQPLPDPLGSPQDVPRHRVAWAVDDHVAFHRDSCEHRFTEGSMDQPGPVGVWIRLLVGIVAGETPTGAQRAAAAADFGNGVSGGLPYDRYTFINPDLTVHLLRPPVGEWIGMRALRTTAPRRRRRAPASPSRRSTTATVVSGAASRASSSTPAPDRPLPTTVSARSVQCSSRGNRTAVRDVEHT